MNFVDSTFYEGRHPRRLVPVHSPHLQAEQPALRKHLITVRDGEQGHLILRADPCRMLEPSLTSLDLSVSLALRGLTVQAVRFKDKMLPANY